MIKFKAQVKYGLDKGKWAEGNLLIIRDQFYITPMYGMFINLHDSSLESEFYPVYENTIKQYIGKDVDGNDIWEGDTVEFLDTNQTVTITNIRAIPTYNRRFRLVQK